MSALVVLFTHAFAANGNEDFFYHGFMANMGLSSIGVKIFAVISGYLVTKSLLQTSSRWRFTRKRLLRLWPALFVVSFLLSFVVGPLISSLPVASYFSHKQTWCFFFRNIVFLPVYELPGVYGGASLNSTYWTLFFETVCYALLLIIGKNMLLKYYKAITWLWVLVMLFNYFVPPAVIPWPSRLHSFLDGISDMMFLFFTASLWFLHTRNKSLPSKKIYLVALAVFMVTVVISIPAYCRWIQQLSLLLFVIEWGRSKPILKRPAWDISYGIFLLGFAVEMIVVHTIRPSSSMIVFFISLLITVPLAFALWYGIEKQALKRK